MELQEPVALMRREKPKRRKPRGERTDAEHWGGPTRKSDDALRQARIWATRFKIGKSARPIQIVVLRSDASDKTAKQNESDDHFRLADNPGVNNPATIELNSLG